MTKWCLLLLISSVLESAHQFPSDNKGIYRNSSSEEIVDETSFDFCRSMMKQIIDRLEYEQNIYKLLQETDARVKYWMFGNGISGSDHWCKTKLEETPLVYFSWNSGQNDCVNLEVFNDNGTPNFIEYICDLNTNSSNVQRAFTDLNFNSEMIIKGSAKRRRSLTRQVIHSYVNLAREIESTECSSPTLNIYFNQTLVFSNASRDVGNNVSMDTIEVHMNVNFSRFYNSVPAMKKKQYSIYTNPTTFYKAFGDCSRQGKELVSVESKEETDQVVAAMNKYQIPNCWTSGHRLGPNHWHWHGSESSIAYTNWDVSEPNNNGKDDYCLEIKQQGGTWSDQDCSSKLPFICQSTVVTPAVEVPPTVNILIDGNLAYEILPPPEYKKDQSNIIEVKIGLTDDLANDRSTKFLLLKKNLPQEAASEQKLVTPQNFINSEFNGIDIRIEHIQQKGLSCQKEKIYQFHTEEKLNYTDAQKFCKNHSSQLVSIQNERQHLDIQKIMLNLKHTLLWTSLAGSSDDWYWSDGEKINYTNWGMNQPYDYYGTGTEYCMLIHKSDSSWYNQHCSTEMPFICESRQKNVAEVPLVVKIFVDEQQAYWNGNKQDQSNIVELTIGGHGNSKEDHSTKFSLVKKSLPQEADSEQRLVVPKSVTYTESNCVDIREEYTKEKGFSCQKDKIYHAHTEEKLSYIDAHIFCQNRSMQLVSIQNKKQHLDIEKLMLKQKYVNHCYWTSGYLAADGSSWLWNGNKAVMYSNWAKGEPNNFGGNEKCMEIFVTNFTAKWNDQECQDKNCIICESFTEPYWSREEK